MPPKDYDDYPEEKPTEETETTEESYLYTYQITYLDHELNRKTDLVEATNVVITEGEDEDHVELWWDEVLMLMVQRSALIGIRNVSMLDMQAQ